MKIQQIRNATVRLDYGDRRILVDPMFARAGSITTLKWVTWTRRRNPLVEIPGEVFQGLDSTTHVLITHCQKGHFDHLDRAATRWIQKRNLPVLCSANDQNYLEKRKFQTTGLQPKEKNAFENGWIMPIPCQHGTGLIGSMMTHGFGYILDFPNSPRVYVIGDSILTSEILDAIRTHKPDVVIMPGGGARFDFGDEVIMGIDDILPLAEVATGFVIVNHLEAIDHCPVTRTQVRQLVQENGLDKKILVPEDGQEILF